ncbi:Dam family site-specific DNA-(adenine-N6)-methyltransferase [Candidatus Avelusimicrobium faecicola]|uniref:DNA adenine methylase n=1 Tax=Candidatus Avelusimicrobium faecicola TaxID=3416205 RepID=UPI0015A390D3
MILSPLNYTGNKSRLLTQLLPLFPASINRFVDVCCGGGSVGINSSAKQTLCIDSNVAVIELLRTLQHFSEHFILQKMDAIIEQFQLSDSFHKDYAFYHKYIEGNNGLKAYNKDSYKRLREFYNNHDFQSWKEKSLYLFVLIAYCFNNDIRFNSKGQFNMPVGKTDFNSSMRKKLSSFKAGIHSKNIKFYMADFSIVQEFKLTPKDFVYVDPPYLITDAVYNENGGWTPEQEKRLLAVLSKLDKQNIPFALSNVLRKKTQENSLLLEWISKNKFNVKFLDYHYRAASYNKKDRNSMEQEVLICNYEI